MFRLFMKFKLQNIFENCIGNYKNIQSLRLAFLKGIRFLFQLIFATFEYEENHLSSIIYSGFN